MFFKYFLMQIECSRTFQESTLNSSTFHVCENPEHSNTSMAQTLMANSPGLARIIIMVPKGHFMHKPHLMAGTTRG